MWHPVRVFARYPAVPLLVIFVLTLFGALSFRGLRRDVFPDLAAPVFNIIVQSASMGPEELEVSVAIPIEQAVAGLPGTRRVRSTSQLGVSQITVEFEPDADYRASRQLVAERIQTIASRLPPEAGAPLVSSLSGRLNEIMELSLEADDGRVDLMTLRDLGESDIRNRLLAVPGVAAVERLGGYLRQLQVVVDPDRMIARGITVHEILHALEGASRNSSGGLVAQGPMQWNTRVVGRVTAAEELRETVVALRGPTPILLGDVADVRDAPAVRYGVAHRLDGEIVSLRIVKQLNADTVNVSQGVRAALAELTPSLPQGVRLTVAYDQAQLVRTSLDGVTRSVLLGAALVVLTILFLLGSARAVVLVVLSLPISLAIAGLLFRRLGIGLDTMSLGGIAVAVGLLADASIIVVENIVHRVRGATDPRERSERAIAGAAAVARPIVFATVVTMAVFAPLTLIEGVEGRLVGALAKSVMAALFASLLVAVVGIPSIAPLVFRRSRDSIAEERSFVAAVKRVYARALDWCMRRAALVRVASLALTIPAIVLALRIGGDFMPELDEGALMLETTMPLEATLEQVDRMNHRVEDVLRTFPEVVDVVRRTGRSEQTEDPMFHTNSDVLIVLAPGVRGQRRAELVRRMRQRVERVPGLSASFTTPLGMRIDEGLAGTPADVSVRIFGPDRAVLERLGERVRDVVADVPGLEEVRSADLGTDIPQLTVTVDRAALARVGMTAGDVTRAVSILLAGQTVGEIWRDGRRFDLVIRADDRVRSDPSALRRILIDAHDGTRVPLDQLASIVETTAPGAARREAGTRRVAIDASVEGRDLASAAAEIRRRIDAQVPRPPGYFVDVGGRVESQARATGALVEAIAIAFFALLVLLSLALGSVSDACVILLTLPDALVGGIAALAIAGETWNVSSLVGLIGLLGIAVQNGLVLVTQTRALVADGFPFEEALRTASVGRVRPKLMTAATAVLGLAPLAFLDLPGSEIERPLAIVMIGGLVTSTLFTLLALPTFYALVERLRERAGR